MALFDDLKDLINDLQEPKKTFILSLLKDYCYITDQIERLKDYPRFIINPKDPKQQKKLPIHEILKDLQAQKNDITTKILKALDNEVGDGDEFLKLIKEYE